MNKKKIVLRCSNIVEEDKQTNKADPTKLQMKMNESTKMACQNSEQMLRYSEYRML